MSGSTTESNSKPGPLQECATREKLVSVLLVPTHKPGSITAETGSSRSGSKALADTAWACTVYSMVPYVGIIFVPFAIVLGVANYFSDRSKSDDRGTRRAIGLIGGSVAILAVQVFLWWLLYVIPEIGL